MKSPEIIVGVDGSPESIRAVQWAAIEADRRACGLLVLHVYDWHAIGATTPLGTPFVADAKGDAEAVVRRAVMVGREAAPMVAVRGEALYGAAAPTLISASANGATIVVGNRGRGGFASLLLGSVSQQVALHAAGSVVVVRGRPEPQGSILVGVDGSDPSQQALAAAFDEASMDGVGVLAVRSYVTPVSPFAPEVASYVEDAEDRRRAEQAALEADVAPWRDKFPDVLVGCAVVEGHPAETLSGMSTTARLVVVGSRGHGGFSGLLLGSIGQQLVHHADCPVLIARPFLARER